MYLQPLIIEDYEIGTDVIAVDRYNFKKQKPIHKTKVIDGNLYIFDRKGLYIDTIVKNISDVQVLILCQAMESKYSLADALYLDSARLTSPKIKSNQPSNFFFWALNSSSVSTPPSSKDLSLISCSGTESVCTCAEPLYFSGTSLYVIPDLCCKLIIQRSLCLQTVSEMVFIAIRKTILIFSSLEYAPRSLNATHDRELQKNLP